MSIEDEIETLGEKLIEIKDAIESLPLDEIRETLQELNKMMSTLVEFVINEDWQK